MARRRRNKNCMVIAMLYSSAGLLMCIFWFHFIFLLWSWGVGNCIVIFVVNTMFLSSTQGTSCSYLLRYCSRPNCIFKVTMTLVAFIAHWLTVLHWLIVGHWPIRKVIWVQTADSSCMAHKLFFRVNFSIQSASECMILYAKFPKFSGVHPQTPWREAEVLLPATIRSTAFSRAWGRQAPPAPRSKNKVGVGSP